MLSNTKSQICGILIPKAIPLTYDNAYIIEGLKSEDRKCQEMLYKQHSAFLLSVCKRYVKNSADAEDVFIEGFYKILSKIKMYSGKGSFEGWMRRIMVNESLMHLRKNNNFSMTLELSKVNIKYEVNYDENIDYQKLIKILDYLPTGYRTVFNMYVIEGYKHREIAEKLDISINTSKSQLIQARKRLQEIIKKKHLYNIAKL